MKTLYVTLGRSGSGTTTAPDTTRESLLQVVKAKLEEVGSTWWYTATQVLVWEDVSGRHNLIAVYDIQIGKLLII